MASAKDIVLRPIAARDAAEFISRVHYSGKTVRNSRVHIGVFLHGRLEGAMQFGPPLDRRKVMGLVDGTRWPNLIELNRLAFTDRLPRNSESRALGIACRLLRRHAPELRWVLTFADGTQCGDGTIYRAAGFLLTGIRTSKNLARLPSGEVIHKMTLESGPDRPRRELGGRSYHDVTGGRYDFRRYVAAANGEILAGHQLRYIKFLDPAWADRLAVAALPYEEIERRGAAMYRGQPRAGSIDSDAPATPGGRGRCSSDPGASPDRPSAE